MTDITTIDGATQQTGEGVGGEEGRPAGNANESAHMELSGRVLEWPQRDAELVCGVLVEAARRQTDGHKRVRDTSIARLTPSRLPSPCPPARRLARRYFVLALAR